MISRSVGTKSSLLSICSHQSNYGAVSLSDLKIWMLDSAIPVGDRV
ncbi:hypothetical protein V2H45_04475 [Tumidithrix elongata RA019]|uniref:Uncharacterized protein n=1 Tax=Tumidithrix elongata BACA0141 TaxID=2716417 RepID=A0AAW9PQX2_9CYAN|nr:hypothetical protein [Tumidithrix elongata RA019]